MNIVLPYPPSANVLWRNMRGRMVESDAARDFKYEVLIRCRERLIEPICGDVSVTLRVFRPRRSGDLDNRIKATLDALNGLAWHDDSQVAEIHAFRDYDRDNQRVEVEVMEV